MQMFTFDHPNDFIKLVFGGRPTKKCQKLYENHLTIGDLWTFFDQFINWYVSFTVNPLQY